MGSPSPQPKSPPQIPALDPQPLATQLASGGVGSVSISGRWDGEPGAARCAAVGVVGEGPGGHGFRRLHPRLLRQPPALDAAMRPVQLRMHAVRTAHENIDHTLLSIDVILTQSDGTKALEQVEEACQRSLRVEEVARERVADLVNVIHLG